MLAALLLSAASYSAVAVFEAPRPGADLQPVEGAEHVIQILQGRQSILWTTLEGTVNLYSVFGWPSTHDDAELAGAVMIRRPTDGKAGVIDFGEKPQTVIFDLGG